MIDGLVVIDKEAGWTSHDVVARCRGIFGQRRVGHAGTLDPGATGVLLVGLGQVTRILRYAAAQPKRYLGELVLGSTTATLDASGALTGRFDMGRVTLDEVVEAAASLTGAIFQVPPMVSAIKIGGRRLHQLAREGIEVERPARPVVVHRLVVRPTGDALRFELDVTCSAGTYVRSLAADLGAALGGGAHLGWLRRLSVGSFGLPQAATLFQVSADPQAFVRAPAEAVRDLTSVMVDEVLAGRVAHGCPIPASELGRTVEGQVPEANREFAIMDLSGRLLAVYEPAPAASGPDHVRVFRPVVVMAPG